MLVNFSTDQRNFLNITLCAGACPGGGAPLEIEKQKKKKKSFQILGPSPYEFLDTRLVCCVCCIVCIVLYIVLLLCFLLF